MAYRLTIHKEKTTKSGIAFSARHLDRHFDISKAPHIDPSRCHLNRYVEFDVEDNGILHHRKSHDIQGHELNVYRKMFQGRLDTMNARYIAQSHKEKCKTLEEYYRSPQSCPDECLIYIGDKDNHPESDVLKAAASELIKRIQQTKSKNFIPLSLAAHLDERGAPHLHLRYIFVSYTDKHGPKVSINKGMKEAGIDLPDPEKAEHKYNNRQMTFVKELRETFADICEQMYGLEIEREARDSSKAGKDLMTFQRDKAAEETKKLVQACKDLNEEKNVLIRAIERLKRVLAPLQRLYDKLSAIRTTRGKTVLEELSEDVRTVEDLKLLHEEER